MEKMTDFFSKRVEGYDEHMLRDVQGCREGYQKMAELVPKSCKSLIDLGCGTGLEIDEILRTRENLSITGIDLTQAMLDKLKEKHPNQKLNLICGSYFDVPFDKNTYDCAISFQTMHHFSHDMKIALYQKINQALTTDGIYIECDYMVLEQNEEDFYYAENTRIRKELHIKEGEFYHYDTPCTIHNQMEMLKKAGFTKVNQVFRMENTTILVASKS